MSLTIAAPSEVSYALAAALMEDFAPSKQHQLLAFTDTFQRLFNARSSDFDASISTEIARVQRQLQRIEWRPRSAAILSECQQLGVRLLVVTEDDYPPLLKQIAVPPPILFVLGDYTNLHLPQLAVVGSRRMTSGGARNAHLWSRHLTACGFTITSGLALGVDGVAHEAAIEVEGGRTVAVMATGIDRIYPRRHQSLAERIVASGGCLVTEFLPGSQAHARHFPIRNRLISGLSLGVLVVEAAVKSGSLITARCGMEQNREVFAIPGSIHSPQSRGCHHLIKQGAHLVDDVSDIVDQLHSALATEKGRLTPVNASQSPACVTLCDEEREVFLAMGYDPIGLDDLGRHCRLGVEQLLAILVALELKGVIARNASVYQRIE